MGQAFERKRSGKRAKRGAKENLWHINKDHETLVVDNNKDKELEIKLVEEKKQVEWKVHDQEEDQVKKKNVGRVIGSNEDVESAFDSNDGSKDIVENDQDLDVSLSSCSTEIQICSDSD